MTEIIKLTVYYFNKKRMIWIKKWIICVINIVERVVEGLKYRVLFLKMKLIR